MAVLQESCATGRKSGKESKFSKMSPYMAALVTGLNILNCSYEGSGIIPNDSGGTGGRQNTGGSSGSSNTGGVTSGGGQGGVVVSSGGSTSSGGATGQGGHAGEGGHAGSGGSTTGTGGAGQGGMGGSVSTGGTTSSGGAGGEGGAVSTGGSGGQGGETSSGGATSSGGQTGSGGAGGDGGMNPGECPGVFADTRLGLWPINTDIDVGGYAFRYTGQISGGVQYDIRCSADSAVLESNHAFTQGIEGTVLRPQDTTISVTGMRIRLLNSASGPANSNSNVVVEAAP